MKGRVTMTKKKEPLEFTGRKKQYYDALINVKEQVSSQMKFHSDEALKSDKDSAGQRAGMATHMADLGSDNSLHDMELKLDCGEKISHERLVAKPHALYCITCKSRMEKEGR